MSGRVARIEVEQINLAFQDHYVAEVEYLVRDERPEEWTVITVRVQLPPTNATIAEIKQAALTAAASSLAVLSEAAAAGTLLQERRESG